MIDVGSLSRRVERPDQVVQHGQFDFGTGFLNREVNELLSELEG
jgi:hypothetical protein